MPIEIGLFALILLITGCFAAGVCAAVIHTWNLKAHILDLEMRLSIVEGNLTREVKARAGQERWKQPAKDQALVSELMSKAAPAARQMNWWERPDLPRSASGT
jgi:hypothetical protein